MIPGSLTPGKPLTLSKLQALLVIHEFQGRPLPAHRIQSMVIPPHLTLRGTLTLRQIWNILRELREEGWIRREHRMRWERLQEISPERRGKLEAARPELWEKLKSRGGQWRQTANCYSISPLLLLRDLTVHLHKRRSYSLEFSRGVRGEMLEHLMSLAHQASYHLRVPWTRVMRLVLALMRRLRVDGPWDKFLEAFRGCVERKWRGSDSTGHHIRDPAAYLVVCLETALKV